MSKYLDSNGLLYLWSKIKSYVAAYVGERAGGGTASSVAWENVTGKPGLALKSDLANAYAYKGSNYGREVSGSAYPWCMVFLQWVFHQAGVPLPLQTASCGALMNAAKKLASG